MKRKSLVRKQMMLYLWVIMLTFSSFALGLGTVYTNKAMKEQEQQFIIQGERFNESMNALYYAGVVDMNRVTFELQVIEQYMEANVFFINREGEVSMVSPGIDEEWVGKTINDQAVEIVLSGNVATVTGKVGGMFKDPTLTVGYPIRIGDRLVGGIFMSKSVSLIKEATGEINELVIGLTIPAILVSIMLIYVFTRVMVNSINMVNKAARVIADGNFDQRIEYYSNDEIGELADSFNYMVQRLEENEKGRQEFIANVSHDLRSPLTSIQGFIGAIADGTIPPEKHQKYFDIVLEETGRLTKLANDMVDASRADAGALVLERCNFDVNEIIRDSLDSMEHRMKQKKIEANVIFAEAVTEVNADPNKIQRVMQNLLDNAVKFTENGGEITVETKLKGSKVYISVRDNGIGIKEEERKRVFERFFKADTSRGLDKTGVGLGLSIVKEFVRAHGEMIEVKSKEGKGTEFTFTLERIKKR